MREVTYRSVLRVLFSEFVALRRSCGADYSAQAMLLAQFDKLLAARRARRVSARIIGDFLEEKCHLTPRAKENLCAVIWPALAHARLHGGPVDHLPPRPALPPGQSRRPYVLTDDELDRLLLAALTKRVAGRPLVPIMYSTIFGLLWATGIRIGEALALTVGDVDLEKGLLTIRAGKFSKARVIPIAPSTVVGLGGYLRRRRRLGSPMFPDAPIFASSQTWLPLSHSAVSAMFKALTRAAGIQSADGRRPRVHDLRHTFAVRTVLTWHEKRMDPNRLLPILRTYMGHVSLQSTQVYLQPNRALLEEVARRFESSCAPPRRRRRGEAP